MANTTTSPNMNLNIPVVGVDPGPQYATDINSCLNIIDQHDHTTGSGVPITPAGLNINTDLTLNGNNLTVARTLRLQPQLIGFTPGVLDIGALYEIVNDLYYTDGAGNQIRITQGGSLAGAAGTITGLPSGTASASFAAGTFVFQAATLTAADIDGGSYILRNNTASSFGLTLSPPNAMGADFTLVLPTLPASQKFMTLDAAGNMAAAWAVDNSTIEVSSNSVRVKAGGITNNEVASNTISNDRIADHTITTDKISLTAGITGGQIATATVSGSNLISAINLAGIATVAGKNILANDTGSQEVVIRAVVNGAGTVVAGGGITVNRVIAGQYVVTFDTPFSIIPGVVFTAIVAGGGPVVCTYDTLSTNSCVLYIHDLGSTLIDESFTVIAMGPR